MSWNKTIETNMRLIRELCAALEASGETIDVQTAVRVIGLYEENQHALMDALKMSLIANERINKELLDERMKNMKLQLLHQVP